MLNSAFHARRFSHENLSNFCCLSLSLSFWQLKMLDYHCVRYWTVQTTMEKCVCIWQSKMDIQRFVCWLVSFRQTVLGIFKFVWNCSFSMKRANCFSPRLGFGGRGGETLDVENQQSQCTCNVKNVVSRPHSGMRLFSPLLQHFYATLHISRNNHRR